MAVEKKLIIIKDGREPKEKYNFWHYNDVFHIGGHPLIDTLSVGDYSVAPYQDIFTIERKVLSDLIGSFSTAKKERQEQGVPSHRDNFREMWERSEGYLQKILMIEGGTLTDLRNKNYRSDYDPNALIASLTSWSLKYKFNWCWVRDEVEGQWVVYWYAKEFLRLKTEGKI